MKSITFLGLLSTFMLQAYGQVEATLPNSQSQQEAAKPEVVNFRVTERGQDFRRYEWETRVQTADGKVVIEPHSYTELASGLHYKQGNDWLETEEEFELMPGWAMANKGPHKLGLAYNLNTRGAVALRMPDGRMLQSQVLALYYLDSASNQSIKLGEVKDSPGKMLPPNQVLYEDAFAGIKADVRYTYTRVGCEQDVILREQPPSPEKLGLSPESTLLVVLTEFFNPPVPKLMERGTRTTRQAQAELSEADDISIAFGSMSIVRGKAFVLGEDKNENLTANPLKRPAPTVKKWLTQDGRHFLFEEVRLPAVRADLQKLPEQASLRRSATRSRMAGLQIPAQRTESSSSSKMQLAQADLSTPGYVLDYVLVNVDTNDFTFKGDTTYYLSGEVWIGGGMTLEGGAVLKFAPTNYANLVSDGGDIDCRTGPYRPCIFTARDDDSVGEIISGSTGVPTNYIAAITVFYGTSPVIHDLKISYANYGLSIYTSGETPISNVQFVHCGVPLDFHYNTAQVRNCLMDYGLQTPFAGQGYEYAVENTTINGGSYLSHSWNGYGDGQIMFTNCIVVGFSNLGWAGVIVTNCTILNSNAMPELFQSVGAGSHYLVTDSNYRNAGTTNIDPVLLADLRQKTTHPPAIYSNVMFATDTVLVPQAQRDWDAVDLGYHYAPIDYLIDGVGVTNATLTLSNGVALGCQDNSGVIVWEGAAISSAGQPLSPNWFFSYKAVQEQPVKLGNYYPSFVYAYNPRQLETTGRFLFTKLCSISGSGGYSMYHNLSWSYSDLEVRNCEFWNGTSLFGGSTNTRTLLFNNLFHRSPIQAGYSGSYTNGLVYANNLNVNGSVRFGTTASSNTWVVFNNAFDGCKPLFFTTQHASNGYNAYFNSTFRLYPTNQYDLVSTNALVYEAGYLGDFYQPAYSALIGVGSTNADVVGLYHFTTVTNQVKETNSMVDIGYHYVAVDGNGVPVDGDGDGFPDYWEDVNGNGLVDSGETSWLNSPNGTTGQTGLRVYTPLR